MLGSSYKELHINCELNRVEITISTCWQEKQVEDVISLFVYE